MTRYVSGDEITRAYNIAELLRYQDGKEYDIKHVIVTSNNVDISLDVPEAPMDINIYCPDVKGPCTFMGFSSKALALMTSRLHMEPDLKTRSYPLPSCRLDSHLLGYDLARFTDLKLAKPFTPDDLIEDMAKALDIDPEVLKAPWPSSKKDYEEQNKYLDEIAKTPPIKEEEDR